MTKEKIKDLIAKMTLEEKAAMCSGADFWHTESCERLGIPASMVSVQHRRISRKDIFQFQAVSSYNHSILHAFPLQIEAFQ